MDSLIGVLIFIVVIILSLASKAQEARKIAERQKEKQARKPQPLSEKARRQIHGRVQPRTATAREGAAPPPPPPARPARKPKPVEQELLETLFGVKLNKEEEEPARPAQREPRVREETQRMVQRLRGESQEPRAARARPPAPPVDADEGPTVSAADVRKKRDEFERQIRALREHMHKGMRRGLAQAPTQPDEQQRAEPRPAARRRPPTTRPQPVRRTTGRRYFETRDDLRRAIVMSEILGRPKSLREDDAAA